MKTDYQYIVIGCGGLGSGALYWLSRHVGADVLGLEQFNLFITTVVRKIARVLLDIIITKTIMPS